MCSGMLDGTGSPAAQNMEVVDFVRIPRALPAGDYVLGWRWDCEQSSQVWSNCADITLAMSAQFEQCSVQCAHRYLPGT